MIDCITPFSTVFQLYCGSQCTYPCFTGVLFTSAQHNMPLQSPIAQSVALWTREEEVTSLIPAQPIFFQRIDDSHCDRIHSSLTAVCCFDNGYVGKQPVAWREYCVEYWLKEFHERMERCTGHRDITEILLKMALNTHNQAINHNMPLMPLAAFPHNHCQNN